MPLSWDASSLISEGFMGLSSTLIVDSSLERLVSVSSENPAEKPVPTSRIVNGSGSSTISGNPSPPRQKKKGGEEGEVFSYLFFSMSRRGPRVTHGVWTSEYIYGPRGPGPTKQWTAQPYGLTLPKTAQGPLCVELREVHAHSLLCWAPRGPGPKFSLC